MLPGETQECCLLSKIPSNGLQLYQDWVVPSNYQCCQQPQSNLLKQMSEISWGFSFLFLSPSSKFHFCSAGEKVYGQKRKFPSTKSPLSEKLGWKYKMFCFLQIRLKGFFHWLCCYENLLTSLERLILLKNYEMPKADTHSRKGYLKCSNYHATKIILEIRGLIWTICTLCCTLH